MKARGIVRKVDDLGRITLPKELRKKLDIKEKDPLELFTQGDMIILKPEDKPACVFCKRANRLREFDGKYICTGCYKRLCATDGGEE